MGYLTYFALLICIALSYDTISARRLVKLDNNERIVGGMDVSIEDYPYMAYVLLFDGRDYYQCGGSIINQRYILTAAHCISGILNATVRIGSSMSMSGGKTYRSSMLLAHPMYNPRNYDYDVAVIRAAQRMDLNSGNASRVTLVRGGQVIPKGTELDITGWGATSEGGPTSSTLMGTTVPTYTNPECQAILNQDTVTDRMLCAGLDEGGKDSCQGDSGGPAVSEGLQIGIVSSGFGCARPDSPGLYTNITNTAIRRWITLNTGV